MEDQSIARKIIAMPFDFYKESNQKSFYELLKDTGYFENHKTISELDILSELQKNPSYARHWLDWSENKRSSPGWILTSGGNKFSVAYSSQKKEKSQILDFIDILDACAAFIVREVEEIRKY